MRRKRFSIEQIVGVLKQAEVGVSVVEVCRQAGITEQTFYRWKKQYAGSSKGFSRSILSGSIQRGPVSPSHGPTRVHATVIQ